MDSLYEWWIGALLLCYRLSHYSYIVIIDILLFTYCYACMLYSDCLIYLLLIIISKQDDLVPVFVACCNLRAYKLFGWAKMFQKQAVQLRFCGLEHILTIIYNKHKCIESIECISIWWFQQWPPVHVLYYISTDFVAKTASNDSIVLYVWNAAEEVFVYQQVLNTS